MAKRGPYRKGEAKRAEILETALEIFAAEGYRGTSLRKVAAQCGLSMPGIMHYFESREDLLTQVLRRRDEDARARHPDPLSVAGAFEVVAENQHTPGLVELFVSLAAAASDPGHPAHAFFEERYRVFRETLAARLEEARGQGRIRSDLPSERLAALVLAATDGIQLQWMVDRSIDMSQSFADLFQLFGWVPPEGGGPV
ncbi:TetR/AcrR family transcriptional regulator [Actinospica durhamensis]|uniref:TetR/AcrR family transcriptional regulator n=1 Tax=Actinospica durhamensis TaxID=1508375 RepID=A0A941IVX1_9ACTN|nr:TetR/AcrR family transcriptional regulator [Actinospica durhamensis]MBR7837941.1 TetR/AcrR family transcriptional regulator [Actinospica durhamensis]